MAQPLLSIREPRELTKRDDQSAEDVPRSENLCVATPAEGLRIVGIDPESNFGGGETQVLGLTLELLRMGHLAKLFCDPNGKLWQRATTDGIVCRPLHVRNAVDLPAGLRLRRLLARERYDIVHFHTSRAHALAPYARGLSSLRIVTRRMDYRPNRWFGSCLYNHAVDGVIAISNGVADALVDGGAVRERIRVVPSGVDCARFAPPTAYMRESARAQFKLCAQDVAVGALGALVLRKGHRVLLKALALTRDQQNKNPEATALPGRLRVLIAGAGPMAAELKGYALELGCQDNVHFVGPLDDPRELLWALDIFAMPSLKEGLGVAVLEAMACGLPVIASATGGLPEVVGDGVSGLLVPPDDATALADALTELASAPHRRAAMSLAGRARAVERFSMAAMARSTAEIYTTLLRQRSVTS